ncbi:MAG: hypothetical protein ACKO0N_04685 [Planctomycetota bacterium]
MDRKIQSDSIDQSVMLKDVTRRACWLPRRKEATVVFVVAC